MNSHGHPDIAHLMASILRLPPAKVMPCDQCGIAPCDHYPCENVTHPDYGLVEIRASAGAKE
jgi:hypothetical protein